MEDHLKPLPALTKRQGDVLLVIARHLEQSSVSPSLGDIRRELHVGDNTNLNTYLRPLIAKGYIKAIPRYARRSFELTPQARQMVTALLRERRNDIHRMLVARQ